MSKFKYSEIFFSMQGEGMYTGRPTAWVRFWGCNFECNGFGQDFPDKPETWELAYQTIDVIEITRMDQLPVITKSCDSSYSWAKRFGHLAYTGTAAEIVDKIEESMKSEHNPEGKFLHPITKQWTHMAFTGGEPMMNQTAMIAIMREFAERDNTPKFVTVETNGSRPARDVFEQFMTGNVLPKESEGFGVQVKRSRAVEADKDNDTLLDLRLPCIESIGGEFDGIEWMWSVSPKLWISGELEENTLKPEVLKQYYELSSVGQLKFVVDGSERTWKQLDKFVKAYRDVGIDWPVSIMPVGATIEAQEDTQAPIIEEALRRGYDISIRAHCWVWGNAMAK